MNIGLYANSVKLQELSRNQDEHENSIHSISVTSITEKSNDS